MHKTNVNTLVLVALGGGSGAALRYGFQESFGHKTEDFALFLVNLVGCFLIGFLTYRLIDKKRTPLLHALVVTGVLGGFTSFSAVMVILYALGSSKPLTGVIVFAVSYVVMCILAVGLGRIAGQLHTLKSARSDPGGGLS